MFPSISIPIWNKSTGGIETINEPGRYVLKVVIPVPQSLEGKSFKIPATDWRLTITDIDDWQSGSKVYVDITNDRAAVNEAITPLQINVLLGIGLLAAFALLVESIEKISPLLTITVYAIVLIVLVFAYARFVHPWLKGRSRA